MISAAAALLMVAGPARAAEALPNHAAEVDAFARIMADVRTAAERCPELTIDWSAVGAEKERFRIVDVDYFAFRKKAHDLTLGMEVGLGDDRALAPWCVDMFVRYGPQGSAKAGLLRR